MPNTWAKDFNQFDGLLLIMAGREKHPELATFGCALRKLRESKGLSVREADALSGIGYGEISETEIAKISPEAATIRKLLRGLQAGKEELSDIIIALVLE